MYIWYLKSQASDLNPGRSGGRGRVPVAPGGGGAGGCQWLASRCGCQPEWMPAPLAFSVHPART
jgi:hypothetical protein